MDLNLKCSVTETERDLTVGDEEAAYETTGEGCQRIRGVITSGAEVAIAIDARILAGSDGGLLHLKNEDPTNFVKVGVATGVYPMEIPPGQRIQVWIPAATLSLFLRADTNNCLVDGFLYER